MSYLPPEVTEHILGYMDTKSLLASRGVCTTWNKLALRLLQLRFTELDKEWHNKRNGLEIFKCFNMDSLPWTSCVLPKIFYDEVVALRSAFLSKFGTRIWKCTFEDTNIVCDFFKMLGMMPNLVEVELPKFVDCFPSIHHDMQIEPLSRLQLIRITFNATNYINEYNLKSILRLTMPSLKCMEISNFHMEEVEHLEGIGALLCNIPKLSIVLSTTSEEVFTSAFKNVKLNIFDLVIQSFMARDCCHPFFVKHLDFLQKLSIGLWSKRDPMENPFLINISLLPSLTHLTINLGTWDRPYKAHMDFCLVVHFSCRLLPKLRELLIWPELGPTIAMKEFYAADSGGESERIFRSHSLLLLDWPEDASTIILCKP